MLREAFVVASRDLGRFWRYRFWLAGQVVMNVADVAIFGLVFGNIVKRALIPDYVKFVTPGILSLSLFISSFSIGREVGIELRREVTDYLLSLPITRAELVAGRLLGGTLRGLIYQAGFVLLAAAVVGPPTPLSALVAAYVSAVLALAMSGISIATSTVTRDLNLQATIRSVTYYVLFFFSNIFYPPQAVSARAPQLAAAMELSPLSIATRVYRWAFGYYGEVDLARDLALLTAWAALLVAASAALYTKNLGRGR